MKTRVDGTLLVPVTIEDHHESDEPLASADPHGSVRTVARKTWRYSVGLLVVVVALGALFRHQLGWGDVPTWVLAITTLLALLAAIFAGLVAYDVLKIETSRDVKAAEDRRLAAEDRQQAASDRRRAEEERAFAQHEADVEQAAWRSAERRAQASKVTAWFCYFHPLTGEHYPPTASIANATWGGAVKNASELPIFDVRIFYYWVNDERDGRPWTAEHCYASVNIIRVIPPGQTRNQELPQRVRGQYQTCDDQSYVVGIEFTDADGVRWFRNERAVLEPR